MIAVRLTSERVRPLFRIGTAATPTVGVVVPTRNRWSTVRQTLVSLLAQDCPFEFAVVVVDDGSTDGTSERLAAWLNSHFARSIARPGQCSVAIYRQPRSGVSAARNLGFRLLRELPCEFLTHQDDDDLALPWKLRTLHAVLRGDPSLGFVHSRVRDMTACGVLLPVNAGYTRLYTRRAPGGSMWARARRAGFEPGALQQVNYIHNAGVMFTRDALACLASDELYPVDVAYAEEWEFHKQLERGGVGFGFCNRAVAIYRNSPTGLFMSGWDERTPDRLAEHALEQTMPLAIALLTVAASRLPHGLRSLPRHRRDQLLPLLCSIADQARRFEAEGRLADAYVAATRMQTLEPSRAHRTAATRLRRRLAAALAQEVNESQQEADSHDQREGALALFALEPSIDHGRVLTRVAVD